MRNKEHFNQFIRTKVQQSIEDLENRRKFLLRKYVIPIRILFSISMIVMLFLFFFLQLKLSEQYSSYISITLVVIPVLFLIISRLVSYYIKRRHLNCNKAYVRDYKKIVISESLGYFLKDFKYYPNKYLGNKELLKSGLAPFSRIGKYSYSGDDFVSGKYKNTKMAFSELHIYPPELSYSSQEGPFFTGIAMVCDFNKKFNGHCIVLSKKAGTVFDKKFKFKTFDKNSEDTYKHYRTENIEFNKSFDIFCNDEVLVHYLLSFSFMEKILQLKEHLDSELSFSFVDNKVYILINAYNKKAQYFEPPVENTLDTMSHFDQIYADISGIFNVIDILKLNTRIWGDKAILLSEENE